MFDKYKEALGEFGTRPNPFPEKDDASEVMDWMLTEFKALPSVISGASNFAVVFSVESLLKLLDKTIALILKSFVEQFSDSQMLRALLLSVQ